MTTCMWVSFVVLETRATGRSHPLPVDAAPLGASHDCLTASHRGVLSWTVDMADRKPRALVGPRLDRCQDCRTVEYRPYQANDLPGVIALCEAEDWASLPADSARTHRLLTNPGVTSYVAVEDG